jgi:hypothetical protein
MRVLFLEVVMPRPVTIVARRARAATDGIDDRLPWPDAARAILVASLLAWTVILAMIL